MRCLDDEKLERLAHRADRSTSLPYDARSQRCGLLPAIVFATRRL